MRSARQRSLLLAGLFVLAALLRLHNAWVAFPLSGYDGPYHAAYIGILYFEGRLPDPAESWGTYHPALYYALCAGIWKVLPFGTSPSVVLFALRLVSVLGGLALGFAVYQSARLLAPDRPRIALSATAVALFIPLQIGPASLIGNEMLAAALCGIGFWLLLLALATPDRVGRSVAAGREHLAVPAGGPALLLLAAMALAAFLSFTHSVATFSTLKGTYITSGFVAFAVFTGFGFDLASRMRPWIGRALAVMLGAWVLMVGALYWSGGLAPLRVNPAEFYVKAYVDAPTHRVFEFFVR